MGFSAGIFCAAAIFSTFLSAKTSLPAYAAGPVHGAKAAGMGTAFIAVADDPSTISHNPAGITQLSGRHLYGGSTAVLPYTRYDSPAGHQEDTRYQIFYPSHLYYTHEVGKITLGIGFFSPFGIGGRKWDDAGQLRYFSTETFMATLTANPTVAWKVTDRLSLAIGAGYMKARNEVRRKIDQTLLGAPDGSLELEADGAGWGYNLGLLVNLTRRARLGAAYRSIVKVDLDGDLNLTGIAPAMQSAFGGASHRTKVSSEAEFPEIYSVGLAYFPGEKLTLAADFELVRWKSFDKADLNIHQEVPPILVSGTTPLDWKDSRQYKAGMDYRFHAKASLRLGYSFITNPVPDHTLEPGNPDADVHTLSMGLGYRTTGWSLDAFYNLGLYERRRVEKPILEGTYRNRLQFAGLSAGYRF
jgi:long-chain fatty acid transport protein